MTSLKTWKMLASVQYRVALRRMRMQQGWFIRVVLGLMMIYSAFILLTLGFFFDRFSTEVWPNKPVIEVVNQFLLAAFVSLFFVRFLFQKTPRISIVPYLHMPIGRQSLVWFFQGASLFSIHNFYPLLFFIPFWLRYVRIDSGSNEPGMWLLAVGMLLLSSHFANLWLRAMLQRRAGWFYLIMTVFMVTAFVDETAGMGVQQRISTYIFSHILSGDLFSLGLLASFAALTIILSAFHLSRSLRESGARVEHARATSIPMPESWGMLGHLIRLELLLLWRNRRPRHYLLVSLLFSTMYLIFMLGTKNAFPGFAFAALLGLFASGGFVLNYGQLMFGWDSSYYPALMTRNVPLRTLVKAKLIVLQLSCVGLFVLSFPLFMWFRPDLIPLHFTFLFYNAGITSVLILELASRNKQAINIGKSGGFFNYEGFSAKHWLWFIPTALPPVLFMMAMSDRAQLALIILATLGFVSVLLSDAWTRYFARGLTIRKHDMLEGFRNSAR